MNLLFIAWTEMKRTLKTPSQVSIIFLMPIVLIFILGSSLSGTGAFEVKDVKLTTLEVGIVREDNGQVMQAFDAFLGSPEVQKAAHPVIVETREQLESKIRNGVLDYGIVIPEGFSDAVMQGGSSLWELIPGSDRNQNMVAGTLTKSFLNQLNASQSAVTVLGPQAAVGAAASGNGGPVIKQEFVTIGKLDKKENNYSSFQYYSVSILVMFILYSGMTAAISILSEKENHTLQRMQTQPVRPSSIVFGKVLGNIWLTLLEAVFVIVFTNLVYGVYWGSMWGWLILICFLMTVISLCLGVLLLVKAKTSKAIRTSFQFIVILMTALSGGFTPIPGMESVASVTVSYWGMQGMLRIMLNSDIGVILQHTAVLGGIAALLLTGSLVAYRRVISYE